MEVKGKTIVLTGKFETLKRADAEKKLQKLGAKTSGSVSSKTNLVFAGKDAGSKLDDAYNLSIPVHSEADLIAILEGKQPATTTKAAAKSAAPEATKGFVDHAALQKATTEKELKAIIDKADWASFALPQDLVALRASLSQLEKKSGVTALHKSCTQKLLEKKPLLRHSMGHWSEISGAALSLDGKYLATGGWVGDDYYRGSTLLIWEVATGRCVNVLDPISGGVGWPDFAGAIQWTRDGSRLGMAFNTNSVGAWEPFGEKAGPVAEACVTDGWDRPPAWCWAPDGQRVYVSCWPQKVEVPGCIAALQGDSRRRAVGYWQRNRSMVTEGKNFNKKLTKANKEKIGEDPSLQPYKEVHWSQDGSMIYGSNEGHSQVFALDPSEGKLVWFIQATAPIAFSPTEDVFAHKTEGELRLSLIKDGTMSKQLSKQSSAEMLVWSPDGKKLAAITTENNEQEAEPAVQIYVEGALQCSIKLSPRPANWQDAGLIPWAWEPSGARAACLNNENKIELWELSDKKPKKLKSLDAPEGSRGLFWSADGVLIIAGKSSLRFVQVDEDKTLGDFVFMKEPAEVRPLDTGKEDLGSAMRPDPTFPLSEEQWAVAFEEGLIIAPKGTEAQLDQKLCWSFDRRLSWPIRWGEIDLVEDAAKGASHKNKPKGVALSKVKAKPAKEVEWPPTNDKTIEDLLTVAVDSVKSLDQGWSSHSSDALRLVVRIYARRGELAKVKATLPKIAQENTRLLAAGDAAVLFANDKKTKEAEALFTDLKKKASSLLDQWNVATISAPVGAAYDALGDKKNAELWFKKAVAAIEPENNAWQNRLEACRAMISCGRDQEAKILWHQKEAWKNEPSSFYSEPFMLFLLRAEKFDLAENFLLEWKKQRKEIDWSIRHTIIGILKQQGRDKVLSDWEKKLELNASEDDIKAAKEMAGKSAPTPGEPENQLLKEKFAALQKVPRARRKSPTRELIAAASQVGHLGAVVNLLLTLDDKDFNDRPQASFHALWKALAGQQIEIW